MIKFYISEGLLIATVIGCLIANRQNKRKISELKTEVAGMKKERIDDWFESASDILEGQQDSIDRLERMTAELDIITQEHRCDIDRLGGRFENENAKVQRHAIDNHDAIEKLTGEIKEIKEILEKTAGIKFTSGEEE